MRVDRARALGYPAIQPGSACAQVAQLVEHATENRSVGGSIPPLGTIPPYASASICRRSYAILRLSA